MWRSVCFVIFVIRLRVYLQKLVGFLRLSVNCPKEAGRKINWASTVDDTGNHAGNCPATNDTGNDTNSSYACLGDFCAYVGGCGAS
jgi:hypothetical protein